MVLIYKKSDYSFLWDGKEETFQELVRESYFHGLNPDKYKITFGSDKVVNDILITDRIIQLSYDLYFGIIKPKEIFTTWNCREKKDIILDTLFSMKDSFNKENFYKNFSPPNSQYNLLKEKLREYIYFSKNFNQKQIAIKKPLRVGDKDKNIPYMRKLLYLIGDLKNSENLNSEEFDISFEEAIKNFQKRHNLKPDGIVGKDTLYHINYPIKERIIDISVNMEKYRWLDQLSPNRIEINIPSFYLYFFKQDKEMFNMKVIVGKKENDDFRPTYLYCSKITKITFNPYWRVPKKIVIKDLIPKIRKDKNYLKKYNFKVFLDGIEINSKDINWYTVDEYNFKFKFIQLPGEKNFLGRVKIEFDNPFDIYLHDTPYKQLFNRELRAFSSGCIRLEDAQLLAKTILYEDGYDKDSVDRFFQDDKTVEVKIKSDFMVYIFYYTAIVGDGTIYFYRDIYDYDKIIKSKLLPQSKDDK